MGTSFGDHGKYLGVSDLVCVCNMEEQEPSKSKPILLELPKLVWPPGVQCEL